MSPLVPTAAAPPTPYGPVPSPQQLAWFRMELIAFCHFGVNTFSDREWGMGTEDPAIFNPTDLDCGQWIDVLKSAGVKEVILTAKHHDGFCLWPSAYTDHSVKASPFRGGKGDVVAEFTDACWAADLKVGIYVSPWDRNSSVYGDSPRYNEIYEKQLTELLSNYGEVSEVWFDGANGEGPNGKSQVYDWDATMAIVRRLAPNSVTFGPDDRNDVRWVGNEDGYAPETNWYGRLSSTIADDNWFRPGDRDGDRCVPSECDVSVRPGWFYHEAEDSKVKSLELLLDIYYGSVGRGGVLLLNVPPDKRGRIADSDIGRLQEFRTALDSIFAVDLAVGKAVTTTNVRGNSPTFAASHVTSGDDGVYWATDDDVREASLEIHFGGVVTLNNVLLQEQIALGQRIAGFHVDAMVDDAWTTIALGTTIGFKRILHVESISVTKLRVVIDEADAGPTLSRVSVYHGECAVNSAPVLPTNGTTPVEG